MRPITTMFQHVDLGQVYLKSHVKYYNKIGWQTITIIVHQVFYFFCHIVFWNKLQQCFVAMSGIFKMILIWWHLFNLNLTIFFYLVHGIGYFYLLTEQLNSIKKQTYHFLLSSPTLRTLNTTTQSMMVTIWSKQCSLMDRWKRNTTTSHLQVTWTQSIMSSISATNLTVMNRWTRRITTTSYLWVT